MVLCGQRRIRTTILEQPLVLPSTAVNSPSRIDPSDLGTRIMKEGSRNHNDKSMSGNIIRFWETRQCLSRDTRGYGRQG